MGSFCYNHVIWFSYIPILVGAWTTHLKKKMLVKLNQFPKDRGEQIKNLFQTKKSSIQILHISEWFHKTPHLHLKTTKGYLLARFTLRMAHCGFRKVPNFGGCLAPSPFSVGFIRYSLWHCRIGRSWPRSMMGFVKNRSMQNNVKKEIHLKVLLTKASRDLDGSKFWKF